MKKIRLLLIIVSLFYEIGYGQNWFNQQTIECTVLLEKKVNNNYVPHGTGFLLINYNSKRTCTVITCEHVLRNDKIYVVVRADSILIKEMNHQNQKKLIVGENEWTLDGNLLRTEVKLIENKTFIKHNSLDIGAFQIDISSSFNYIGGDSIMPLTDTKGIPKSMIKTKKKVSLGEDIYFLGFPYMIGTQEGLVVPSNIGAISSGDYKDIVSNPVIRSGIIAWKSDINKEFLLDALSYGGNSGSPVFTKSGFNKMGPYLIGMVIGHLGEELEISKKAQNIDINPKGNAGLARCIWIDDILTLYNRLDVK